MQAQTQMPVETICEIYRNRYAQVTHSYGMRRVWPYLLGRKVLDLGCGDGGHLERMAAGSVGVDCAPKNLEACRRKGLCVVEHDINRALPFDDGAFHAVLISHVLEHMESPLRTLREARRSCVPGGYIVVAVPVEKSICSALKREHYFRSHSTHVYGLSPACIGALFRHCSIRPVDRIFSFPWLKRTPRLHDLANRLLGARGEWVATVCWSVGQRAF